MKMDEVNNKGGNTPTSAEDMSKFIQPLMTWRYMLTEPTLYVTLIMAVIEPSSKWQIFRWYGLWMLSGALGASKLAVAKTTSVSIGLYNTFVYPVTNPYLAAISQMKSLLIWMRIIEIIQHGPTVFERLGSTFASRYCLLYHDVRKAVQVSSPEEHRELFQRAVGDVFVAIGGLMTTMFAFNRMEPLVRDDGIIYSSTDILRFLTKRYPRIILRSYLGAFRLWGVLMSMDTIHRAHLLYYGIKAPSAFDHPYKSKTVGEFFSKRWDLAIGRSLSDVFFKPLARAGYRQLGELTVFNASALLHVYLVRILGGTPRDQAWTMTFFMIELGLIQLERKAKLHGRVYFNSTMFLFGPLFYEPLFHLLPPF